MGRYGNMAVVVAVSGAAVFGLFAPPLWRGEIPLFMDIVAPFYPIRFHAAELLHAGQAPWWNRSYYLGVPLLANPQWGLLYPGVWPFLLRPTGGMFLFNYPLHILIGALGCHALTLEVTGGRRAAAWVALGFSIANSWTWTRLAYGSYLSVTALAPWVIWLMLRHAATGRRGLVVAAGALWALQLLAGAPQMAWYAALHYGLLAVALALPIPLRRPSSPPAGSAPSARWRWRPIAGVLALGILGAAWAAPQLAPTAFLMAVCERAGGLDWPEVAVGTLDGGGLMRALLGGTGAPFEDAGSTLFFSLGGLIFILASLGAARRNRPLAALWVLLVADLLFSNRLVGRALYAVFPLYDQFHDPKRILGLAQVWMAVLAGVGCVVLADGARRWVGQMATWRPAPRYLAWAGAVAVATPPLWAVGFWNLGTDLCPWRLPPFLGWIDSGMVGSLRQGLMAFAPVAAGIALWPHLSAAEGCRTLRATLLGLWMALATLTFSLERVDGKMIHPDALRSEAGARLAALAREARTTGGDPLRFISLDLEGHYSYAYGSADFASLVLPDLGALYGLEDVQGYDPTIPAAYGEWLDGINAGRRRLFRRHFGLVHPERALAVDPAPWGALVCRDSDMRRLLAQPATAVAPGGTMEPVGRAGGDGSAIVLVRPERVMPYIAVRDETGALVATPRPESRWANGLTFRLPPHAGPLAVEILDANLPGWTIRVDGGRAAVHDRPLLAFTAPPSSGDGNETGERLVTARYFPPGLALGLAIWALATGAALLALRRMGDGSAQASRDGAVRQR